MEADLTTESDRLAREHGPWRNSIRLAEGVYTADRGGPEDNRARAILQAVADGAGAPLSDLRVLDLGSAEGLYSTEFAEHCREVVAVEGRPGNVAKARFVKSARGLDNLSIEQVDVRNLDTTERFDVVLCLGLLYHLDGEAAVKLVHDIAAMTTRLAIVDTHVALQPKIAIEAGGRSYWGRHIREFDRGASEEEQERLSWSAIGNPEAFWMTRPSLLNLIEDAGFTSASDLALPYYRRFGDRVALLTFKGTPVSLVAVPGEGRTRRPEDDRPAPHSVQLWHGRLRQSIAPHAPAFAKEWVRARRERRRA
jgi:SAM-dependent methyltransferase